MPKNFNYVCSGEKKKKNVNSVIEGWISKNNKGMEDVQAVIKASTICN